MAPPETHRVTPRGRTVAGFSVRISDSPVDPDWDAFLERAEHGHYAQTSAWGRGRTAIGWRAVRVVITEDDAIVAGAQMVARPMPAAGDVGFVCRGPIAPADRPDLARLAFDEMQRLAHDNGVQYLVVQPPRACGWMSDELRRRGFRLGAFDIDFTSTVLIDLRPELEEVFARMSKKCRQHVRTAQTQGITVRRGSLADLAIFNRLKDVQSARLGYARREDDYYRVLWDALEPGGHIALLIAEFGGEPISAQLLIPFGDTCQHMEAPWSGAHGDFRPNELLHWEAFKWAKAQGCSFSDLGGIESEVADAVLSGRQSALGAEYSQSIFKLKFGGGIINDPPSMDYVFNPVLRFAYRCIPVRLLRAPWMRKLLFKFRETGS